MRTITSSRLAAAPTAHCKWGAERMRAVMVRKFGGIDAATLGELPKPVPKENEVLVAIHATAANFVDLLVIGGKYQFLPERPFAPGKLPAGVVVQVGAAVRK